MLDLSAAAVMRTLESVAMTMPVHVCRYGGPRSRETKQANQWDQALLDSSAQALARERAGSIGIDSVKPEEELNRDREMRLQSGKG